LCASRVQAPAWVRQNKAKEKVHSEPVITGRGCPSTIGVIIFIVIALRVSVALATAIVV